MKRKLKGLLGMAVMVATVLSTAGTIPSMAAEKTETEDNNRLEKASSLSLNENMKGSLSDEDDVDFYKFEIPDDGKVSITFKHEYAKGSFTTDEAILWKSQIYNAEGENLLVSENYDEYAGKNKEEQEGRTIGLPRGTYYLKVEKGQFDHSEKEYTLKVNYTKTDDYEIEDNDVQKRAFSIPVNKETYGSLMTASDVDWFAFEIPDDGKVSITFKHEYAKGRVTTDEAILWTSQIYNAEGENLLVSENYDEYAGKNKEEQEGRTIGLPRGTYYLKVESDSYSGKEYMLKVNVSVPDMGWINMLDGKSYWYEGKVRQGTYDDPQGVLGDGTVRGREICDMSQKDDAGQDGVWFWLDSVYNGAKATGKEVWMPYIYQNEAEWSEEDIERIAAESDYGMEGMGRCVRDAIKNKDGKWVRYDNDGKMLKGWVEIKGDLATAYPDQKGNTYYYDTRTGLMAKGWVKIDGKDYFFDEVTGVLQ